MPETLYEVIIIGGGFAGASAALTLGRLKRSVLLLDSAHPCNQGSDGVHNLLLAEGINPGMARDRFQKGLSGYNTITYKEEVAERIEHRAGSWLISTVAGNTFSASKILFCTGLTDRLPDVSGMNECWGKTVLHCPYCHGYEMHGTVGIAGASVNEALALAGVLHNLSLKTVLFTEHTDQLAPHQADLAQKLGIECVAGQIAGLLHEQGNLSVVTLSDGRQIAIDHLYISPESIQKSNLPALAGCEFTDRDLICINEFYETSVSGIYAAGDCCSTIRYASAAMSSGNIAGSFIHQGLCKDFAK